MEATYQDVGVHDGAVLRVARFDPVGPLRGVVQYVHGYGEYIALYEPLAASFTDQGYAFVIHDRRSHGWAAGRMSARRTKALGVVRRYSSLLDEVAAVRERIDDWYPARPVVLGGMSMGGNVVANYLQRTLQPRYNAAIIESPWFSPARPMPGLLIALNRVIGAISATASVPTGMNPDAMSRDPAITAMLKAGPKYNGGITCRLLTLMMRAGQYAVAHAADIKVPALLMMGTSDQMTSLDAIRKFANRAGPNLTFRQYAGGFHCLHDDICEGDVRADMLAFCHRHS